MLNICLITAIAFLCIAGIYFTVQEVVSLFTQNDAKTTIFLEVYNDIDKAEQCVRSVIAANPISEIYVIDKSENDEISKILSILADENNQIHIKTAPEK